MGIAKGKLRPEAFKSKVEDILATLQLPVQVGEDRLPFISPLNVLSDVCVSAGVCGDWSWDLQETSHGNVEPPV